ncbi:hypothetical protein LEP1GSC047_1717 [Leptospira inadai serovar Lyme str. 10]|uniref:Uncharacterized protein n=2 Tax=Leptospira inadai serovar Lyme TaxID=293084 RepID=V6H8P4_9LEPT|nr:hypothetical protein [Leptospira inadai]EQA35331.1 hypothetical protein LEP1GSC047_1717 [Leptospira inadai serovar Lyme str. 10]PNV76142.1 hypothetical protein BES34_003800 [Leptospira inadai serovar Lyme]
MSDLSISVEFKFKNSGLKNLVTLNNELSRTVGILGDLTKSQQAYSASFANAGKDAKKGAGSIIETASKGFDGLIKAAKGPLEAFDAIREQEMAAKNLAKDAFPALQQAIKNTIKSSRGLSNQVDLYKEVNKAVSEYGVSIQYINNSLPGFQKLSVITGKSLAELYRDANNAIKSGSTSFLNNAVFAESLKNLQKQKKSFSDLSKAERENLIMGVLQNEVTREYNTEVDKGYGINKRFNNSIDTLKSTMGGFLGSELLPLAEKFLYLIGLLTETENGLGLLKIAAKAVPFLILFAGVVKVISAFQSLKEMISSIFSPGKGTFNKYFENIYKKILPKMRDWIRLLGRSFATFGRILSSGFARAIQVLGSALGGFGRVIGTLISSGLRLLVPILISGASAAWAFLAPILLLVGKFILIAAAVAAVIYGLDQLYGLLTGGKSFIKDFVDWIGSLNLPQKFQSGLSSMGNFFSSNNPAPSSNSPAPATPSGTGAVSGINSSLFGGLGSSIFSLGAPGGGNGGGSGSVVVQNVVGTLTINVSGPGEAGREIKDAVMRALDELSQDVLPAKLGMVIP